MTTDNLQGQLTTLKFRLDQIYREFIDMGPNLKNGLTRISDLEKKSERLDAAESLHDKFSTMEKKFAVLEGSTKGKHDILFSDMKAIKERFQFLKEFADLQAEYIHLMRAEVDALKKTVSDSMKETENVHASALKQSKKDFESSIQDIRKKLQDYSLEGIGADIMSLGAFYKEIIERLQRYDKNFQTIDKRLSNINLNFAKQNSDRKA